MDSILLSKKDAARVLGVSLRTVDNLLTAHELPTRRIGRRVLIPRRALELFAKTDHDTMGTADTSMTTGTSSGGAQQ